MDLIAKGLYANLEKNKRQRLEKSDAQIKREEAEVKERNRPKIKELITRAVAFTKKHGTINKGPETQGGEIVTGESTDWLTTEGTTTGYVVVQARSNYINSKVVNGPRGAQASQGSDRVYIDFRLYDIETKDASDVDEAVVVFHDSTLGEPRISLKDEQGRHDISPDDDEWPKIIDLLDKLEASARTQAEESITD
jgi:hypothetical protein